MDEVKRELARERSGGNWVEKIAGSFEGDPDFEAALRLGSEFRQSQRPSEGDSSTTVD